MNVLITGSSNGIGEACVSKFLDCGYDVYGFDIVCPNRESDLEYYRVDVRDKAQFPNFGYPMVSKNQFFDIVVNCAGVQDTDHDVETNLIGTMNVTEEYVIDNKHIKSVVNMASVSAHNGAEFGPYVASKGGVLSYTRWTAKQISKYGGLCNSLSFGGVITPMNDSVVNDRNLFGQIMDMTPLRKWATPEECAEWVYFLTCVNKSCSGQDIIVDNLETLNHTFVWP